MAVIGANYGDQVGGQAVLASASIAGQLTTFAMAALNSGWCARFMARDTRDIATVYLNWSTVTAAGVVNVRIETIDATSGKPSGSLYDANATLSQAPSAGWQAWTFASLPTTGLVAGNEYAIVALTTTLGTTMTLRSHITGTTQAASYPTIVETAADGTTRTNFAEVTNANPIATLVMEDSAEEPLDFAPWATLTNYNVFTTNAAGMKFIVPTNETWNVRGIKGYLIKVGTPAGDLRVRILNSSDAAVSGATCTVDKDSLATSLTSVRGCIFPFAAPVALAAGTYRIAYDSSASANSSNCWRFSAGVVRTAALAASGHIATNTVDITAGPPVTWTDTNTEEPPVGLLLDTTSATGGSSGMLYVPSQGDN